MNSTTGFLFAAALVAVSASACTKDKTSDSSSSSSPAASSSAAPTAPAASSAAGDSVLVDIKYGDALPARGTTPITQQAVRGGSGTTVVGAASRVAAEEDTNRTLRKHAHVDKVDCTALPDNVGECDGNNFYFCDDSKLWVVDCDAEAKFGGAPAGGACYEGEKFIDCLATGKAPDGTEEACDFSRTVCCDKAGACFSPAAKN